MCPVSGALRTLADWQILSFSLQPPFPLLQAYLTWTHQIFDPGATKEGITLGTLPKEPYSLQCSNSVLLQLASSSHSFVLPFFCSYLLIRPPSCIGGETGSFLGSRLLLLSHFSLDCTTYSWLWLIRHLLLICNCRGLSHGHIRWQGMSQLSLQALS